MALDANIINSKQLQSFQNSMEYSINMYQISKLVLLVGVILLTGCVGYPYRASYQTQNYGYGYGGYSRPYYSQPYYSNILITPSYERNHFGGWGGHEQFEHRSGYGYGGRQRGRD
jgi:hypothetical protein